MLTRDETKSPQPSNSLRLVAIGATKDRTTGRHHGGRRSLLLPDVINNDNPVAILVKQCFIRLDRCYLIFDSCDKLEANKLSFRTR